MKAILNTVAFSEKRNPFTARPYNEPFYKARWNYSSAAEKYHDQYRFCADKDLQDFVKSGVNLSSPDAVKKIKELTSKLRRVVSEMEQKAGFVSWYGDLFEKVFADEASPVSTVMASRPITVVTDKPVAAPAAIPMASAVPTVKSVPAVKSAPTANPVAKVGLLSGEALAKRFMAELLTPDFLAEIAKQQLSEEGVEKEIAARGEAIITSLKSLADPEAYAEFYAAYRKQHPESKPEMVVAEAAIIETSVDNGEPKVLSELVNQSVEASGSLTAMADKLSRAAALVQEGKRKKQQKQHRRAA